ncbi:MAG TPA: type IV pilin protein [Noviherbaspirillum sp.]|nr:type IV pilin protein [Noviherbaspirillum sp.]
MTTLLTANTQVKLRRAAGFSLIELMVAVAIVGIIGAVAIPSYQNYMVKSSRAAAQSHLLEIAQAQQQFVVDNRAYASTLTELNGMTTPPDISKYYTVTIDVTSGPPPTFIARATPKAGTRQASDVTLTINNAGTKEPSDKW